MNNNNVGENLNNNFGTTSQPMSNNNLNTISTQGQSNNEIPSTNGLMDAQFNTQNNSNLSIESELVKPTVYTTTGSASINQANNNTLNQSQINNINPVMQNNFQSGSEASNLYSSTASIPIESASINQTNNNTLNQSQINNINPVMQNNFQSGNDTSNLYNSNVSSPTEPTSNINLTTQNITNNLTNASANQTIINTNFANNEELLKAFIGKNYDKITTKRFNFSGFFFTMLYMFYRKMFLYGIILFLIMLSVFIVIDNIIITILFSLVVGVLVNKIYLYYANKKIDKIKIKNSQKDINQLKEICSKKGGTSVGKIFLGFFTMLSIVFVVSIIMIITGVGNFIKEFFNLDNWNITINGNVINENTIDNSNKKGTLIEDVKVMGYSSYGTTYNIFIGDLNEQVGYLFAADNVELIKSLSDYRDDVKLNIYYSQKGEEKTIVNYELFLKSTNENISNIKTEEELRTKIGLYNVGTHTATFTLTSTDEFSSVLKYCTFIDEKNNEYEMDYRNPDSTINLVVGNKYNVTFEVVKGTFDYEYNVISIK